MTHEIELEGYYPKILGSPMRMLCLGTKASYGMEVLHFQRGTGWDGLALDVTFTPDPQAEGTTVLADAGDTVAVPPAATAQATNSGSVTVRGVRDGVQCISCNIPYLVLNHAPVPGQQTDPAESVWKQYADKLIPAGGNTGQVLAKASAQDMDLYWADGTTTQTETTPHMLTTICCGFVKIEPSWLYSIHLRDKMQVYRRIGRQESTVSSMTKSKTA